MEWHDMAWLGVTWHGMACCVAWHDMVRYDISLVEPVPETFFGFRGDRIF